MMNSRAVAYDALNNVITMSVSFRKRSQIVGTPEYSELLTIIQQTGCTSFSVVNKGKSTKDPRLTYAKMRQQIRLLSAPTTYMERFETMVTLAKCKKNPYKVVEDWYNKHIQPELDKMMADADVLLFEDSTDIDNDESEVA